MFEYLDDIEFLKKLDKMNIRVLYAKIILLSFDEKPIREILGDITSGNLSVNGSSAVRRTLNLTMLATPKNSNIEDIDNEISIDKKIKVLIGYKNPFRSYKHYGDIIWFPCGVFVISSATISRSTTTWSISITAKDKMCLLNGIAGGTLPASTTFHESLVELKNGDYEVLYPTFYLIIFEAVNHWGGEAAERIIIDSSLGEPVKMLVRYMGDSPVYLDNDFGSLSFSENPDFPLMYSYGLDIGYKPTDFTYPGELILNAGDTVVTLLDRIVKTLGNYEYFYDIDGNFVFLPIKNYLNTGSPLTELEERDYVKSYNNAKFLYSLTELDSTTAITRSPKFDNMRNDFYVWGTREVNDIEIGIRYHLAIDTKPIPDLATKNMWELRDEETDLIVRYEFTEQGVTYTDRLYKVTLVGKPCEEWREELYRRALVAQVTNSVYDNYYDSELLAEWRNLYDTMNINWPKNWNPDVYENPDKVNFWLDFINVPDTKLGKYGVKNIGRRSKVVTDSKIRSVYNREVPDVIFLDGLDYDLMESYRKIGLYFFVLTPEYLNLFLISTTGTSCFDRIREMMYLNLNYNTTISLTCLPKYYMEPNNIIYIEDKASGISGNYLVTLFTLPLAYNGTMSITATEVLTRV